MYLPKGFFMSFNKTAMLFLFCTLMQTNIFTMVVKIVNPKIFYSLLYTAKETYHYFVAEKNRFTGLADVVTENKNEEYEELKQHENDVTKLKEKYKKIKSGDKRQPYQIVKDKYGSNINKFSEDFKKNVQSMTSYNPLNWKNILLFGPVMPVVEWVIPQLFEKTPIRHFSSQIFAESCAENKQIFNYIFAGFNLFLSSIFVYGLSHALIKFLLIESLPFLIEQSGIEIKIPQKYQPLITQGIVGFILDKMKKS